MAVFSSCYFVAGSGMPAGSLRIAGLPGQHFFAGSDWSADGLKMADLMVGLPGRHFFPLFCRPADPLRMAD